MASTYEHIQEEFSRLRDYQLELRDVLVNLLEDNDNSFRIKRSEIRMYDQIILHDAESPEQLQHDFITSEQSYNTIVSSLKSRYPKEFEDIELFSSSPVMRGENELKEEFELNIPLEKHITWQDFKIINALVNNIAKEQEKEDGREI